MKQSNFYFFRRTAIFLSVLVAMLLATVVTGSADEKAPTRKEPLDLSLYTETVDMLDSEGWKYEPAENGGVLTLHDFYLKGDHSLNYGAGLIYGDGTITIVLEGTNVIETTSSYFRPLMQSKGLAAKDVSWIIKESENKGSLEIRNGSGEIKEKNNPYGFSADDLTIESGAVTSDIEFCMIAGTFTLNGGSLTVTVPEEIENSYPVCTTEAEGSDVIINGGKLVIPQGDWGITAGESGAGDFVLNGGSVEVHSDMAAIFATDIKLKDGYLKASGKVRATRFAVDTSEYQGSGSARGSVNLDGSASVEYDPKAYKTYKWIEFPHEHSGAGNWIFDGDKHWKLCECGEKADVARHSLGEWTVVKEATSAVNGEKVRKCEICAFEEKEVIPVKAASGSDKTDTSAETGDRIELTVPLMLALLSAAGIGSVAVVRRKSS